MSKDKDGIVTLRKRLEQLRIKPNINKIVDEITHLMSHEYDWSSFDISNIKGTPDEIKEKLSDLENQHSLSIKMIWFEHMLRNILWENNVPYTRLTDDQRKLHLAWWETTYVSSNEYKQVLDELCNRKVLLNYNLADCGIDGYVEFNLDYFTE